MHRADVLHLITCRSRRWTRAFVDLTRLAMPADPAAPAGRGRRAARSARGQHGPRPPPPRRRRPLRPGRGRRGRRQRRRLAHARCGRLGRGVSAHPAAPHAPPRCGPRRGWAEGRQGGAQEVEGQKGFGALARRPLVPVPLLIFDPPPPPPHPLRRQPARTRRWRRRAWRRGPPSSWSPAASRGCAPPAPVRPARAAAVPRATGSDIGRLCSLAIRGGRCGGRA